MNGYSRAEDQRSSVQYCCLTDEGKTCRRPAGNAVYNKRIQKQASQKRLKLNIDNSVS